MKKNLTTLKSIAENLGLSVSTVSRVLSGKSRQYRISRKTEQAVLDMSREMNFSPNQLARGLRLNKTQTIGLVIPDISNPFFASIARNVEIQARKKNYSIILCDSQETTELEIESIQLLLSRKVEGLVILPVGQKYDHLVKLEKEKTPAVIIDRYLPELKVPYVASNNYKGSFEAVRYLIDKGHKNIACIQGLDGTTPNEQRVRGYTEAIRSCGMEPDTELITGDSYSRQSGYLVTKKLLTGNKKKITAIFALSNLIALGAIKAIREQGLSIPDDISLICFDDQPYLAYMDPPITTVDQMNEEMGQVAVKLLFVQLEGRQDNEASTVILDTNFIERNSVKTINKQN